jgi:ATP-dependent helicase/nuclease subunit B
MRSQTREELHRSDPRKLIADAGLDAAADLVAQLAAALKPLENLTPAGHAFATIAACHRDTIAALSADGAGRVAALEGNDGKALGEMLEEIATSLPSGALAVAVGDYPELFHTAISDRAVRRPEAPGLRVRIFGPLEARLQQIDRMVLGGLAEGSWPPETRTDPWLSRPMRQQLGLDLPERRIGLSAHDFAQALGAREVILTRAAKIAGAPTVMSRFVRRLAAVAGEPRWNKVCERGGEYLAFARELDRPRDPKPAKRPAPKPPRAARPTALSVTAIEDWLRDPYTIYAKYILRLAPLDEVDTPPGARDRGTVIHEAIGEFTENFAAALPTDPAGTLIALGRKHFSRLEDFPEARAFWWPRFVRIAHWFAGWETERRPRIATLHAEIHGAIAIQLGEREFRLSAIADRIERLSDGSYVILDYKTGVARSEKQVRTGLAPQLTLEAAILRRGGFKKIPAGGSVAKLVYVTLKGGEPPGVPREIDFKQGTPDTQADAALARLTDVAIRFEDEATAYHSLVHPMWATHYGDYDHLARVKEWSATGGAGAGDEGGGE